jgi:cell division protein FtsW
MNNFGNHKNLLLMVLLIIFIGSFLMYSASSSFALYTFNKSDSYFFVKHIIWFLIGMVGLFILSNINYKILKDNAILILCISWLFMFIPIFQKIVFNGDSIARWLKIGNFSLMTTSDFGKLGIIIFTSMFIEKYHDKISDLKFLIKNFLPYLFITIFLILCQPDLSTSIVLILIIFSMLYIAGISNKIILFSFLSSIMLFAAIILLSDNYQQDRLFNWLSTFGSNQPYDQSYFSVLALANGGFLGKGIGDSIFKHNGFIPEGQTDFILAIIGEEIGFLGITVIFSIFLILFFQGIGIAKNCSDRFSMFLSLGIITNIFIYLLINAFYVIGILPTTGLPIPFISYGGSQTIFTLASIGILLNISKSNFKTKNYKNYYVKV